MFFHLKKEYVYKKLFVICTNDDKPYHQSIITRQESIDCGYEQWIHEIDFGLNHLPKIDSSDFDSKAFYGEFIRSSRDRVGEEKRIIDEADSWKRKKGKNVHTNIWDNGNTSALQGNDKDVELEFVTIEHYEGKSYAIRTHEEKLILKK